MISEEEKEDIAIANYQDGLEKGLKKGREEGAAKQAEEIARRMLAKEYPIDAIIEISGLRAEQVKAL